LQTINKKALTPVGFDPYLLISSAC